MSLKYGLLGLLNYKDMTGYELDKLFRESLNFFWQAKTSQVYKELTAMENSGWLTSKIIIQTSKPNKKLYHITKEGQEILHHWLLSPIESNDCNMKSSFLMQLFFSGELSVETSIKHLEEFQKIYESANESKTAIQYSIQNYENEIADSQKATYWRLTASFGEYYHNMCIAWSKEAIAQLKQLKEENP